ncbi:MAG: hypothetical protein EOO16_16750 [Chitinophagaceae bacterium]|nr:MAG: hypothetical protein EOO16_16750 [Chitinophagaceae bacterium]
MRLLIAIFTFLCVHLLGVPVNAYGGKATTALLQATRKQPALQGAATVGSFQVSDALLARETGAQFDSAESQDEDEHEQNERRQLLVVLGSLTDSHAFILSCLSSFPRKRLYLQPQPLFFGSDKYIAHRVIRI